MEEAEGVARTTRLQEERLASQRQPVKIRGMAMDIAKHFACSLPEVEQILQREIHSLDRDARIKEFVPLLASKRVKDWLTLNLWRPSRAI